MNLEGWLVIVAVFATGIILTIIWYLQLLKMKEYQDELKKYTGRP